MSSLHQKDKEIARKQRTVARRLKHRKGKAAALRDPRRAVR